MDTSDEWIRERTGIRERRVGGTTSGWRSRPAGPRSSSRVSTRPRSTLVLLATTTPDQTVPGTSATVQNNLGLRCGAFDINAACSGFVYGLAWPTASSPPAAATMLVIGTETLSRITDWTDRGTAILFADGAGAVVLDAVDGPGQLLAWDLDADGAAQPFLYADIGDYLKMDGKEVFRRAVRIMVDSAAKSLKHAGVTADDIDAGRAPPGQHPHHRRRLPAPRHPDRAGGHQHRPHRQHLGGVDPAGAGRRPRRGPGQPTATSCCSSASAPA